MNVHNYRFVLWLGICVKSFSGEPRRDTHRKTSGMYYRVIP